MFAKKESPAALSLSNAESQADNTFSPQEIEKGVYTGSSYSADGEKIYLRMELITQKNTSAWKQYKDCTHKMTNFYDPGDTGALISLAQGITEEIAQDGSIRYVFKNKKGQSYIPEYGFNENEFKQYIDFLGKQGFTQGSKKLAVLKTSSSGSAPMNIEIGSGSQYIVYASKTPDFLITNIPIEPSTSSIKSFTSQYGNLLMSMGSNFSDEDWGYGDFIDNSFQNRGISRNPISLIENTHTGLAMILHGFSGAVAQKFFPHMETMHVRPIGFMQNLICNTFKNEDVTLNGGAMTLDEAKEITEQHKNTPNGIIEYATNYIKIGPLADCYYKACQTPGVTPSQKPSTKAKKEFLSSSGFVYALENVESAAKTEHEPVYADEGKRLHQALSGAKKEFLHTGNSNNFVHSVKEEVKKSEPVLKKSPVWKQFLLDILNAVIFICTLGISYMATGRIRFFKAQPPNESEINEINTMRQNLQ